MTPGEQNNESLISQIRANIAFEHMVAAVLSGALLCLALSFSIETLISVLESRLSVRSLASALFSGVRFGAFVFLFGFILCVIIGLPLFRYLENEKIRLGWPYYVSGFIVQIALLTLLSVDSMGSAALGDLLRRVMVLVPAPLIVFFFIRRIKPLWRAAQKADGESKSQQLRVVN